VVRVQRQELLGGHVHKALRGVAKRVFSVLDSVREGAVDEEIHPAVVFGVPKRARVVAAVHGQPQARGRV